MIRWFAGHPTAGNLLLILILAAGLFAAPNLTRETFPDYLPPEVSITMEYRGATAADVEEAICQRLGEALQRVDYMQEITCTARDNQALTIASMGPGGDMGRFLDDIRTEIEALTDLPEEAEDPIIRELYRTDLVAAIAVTGPMSFAHLESYTKQLEDRLFAIDGVADVIPIGLSQRQWQVELSRDRLRQYGLGVQDIARTIGQQNVDMPLGTLETDSRDIQLRFVDERRSLQTLANLPVLGGHAGAVLTLGDIATLTQTHERKEERAEFNGQRAIILEIHKNRHDDALRVMDSLQAFIAEETARRDGTVNLEITQDMTSIVRDRLQMLVGNGITGLLLVGLVMALFFRPRLAFWALFGLPAAFAGAFVMMALTGLSLNMITLVALLMAIGIVMDDSVVITENIARHANEGTTPLQAATDGTLEILPGVLSSFLTTASVFVPLAFLAGELGSVLEVLPVVLIAALAASLIEAFWILPHHLKNGLGKSRDKPTSRFRARFDRGFEATRGKVGQLADTAIRFRYGVLADITDVRQWAQVTRIDGLRTVTVSADVNGRKTNADAIVTDLQNRVFQELRERWPEIMLQVEGQTARSRETGQSIARGLLIGLLGIFLILSFQFRSYLEPLIVMLSIPVAFMGAVWGHLIMGYNLSMPSLIGAASLAGIVVNNAILLVQFIKSYREQGMTTAEAAGAASRNRFRAILITTSTTVAGLLPLLAETSTQAMAVIPLVISVVFGLLVSTLVVLLGLPALYVILEDLGWATSSSSR
ncbi:MAG: efflux RND transporter permease subunit [Pseudomonadota bacterium]|nr:efflux RND transporter permease subunit [Pseudomonadota bacterium]